MAQDVADLNNKAVQLTKAGEFMEAIEIWLGLVEKVDPEYEYLWAFHLNIGRAFHKLLDPAPAWWHLTRSAELNPAHKKTLKWLDEVETALGKGHVKVTVKGFSPGTRVRFIHGKKEQWYPAPFTWWFKPGSHKLTARAEGYKGKDIDIVVNSKSTEVELYLKKDRKRGTIIFTVEPREAAVYLNKKQVGSGGFHGNVDEGSHVIDVKLDGYKDHFWGVHVSAGSRIKEHVVLIPTEVPPPPVSNGDVKPAGAPAWKWILAGSSVAAALAGGMTFYIAAGNATDERDAITAKYNLGQGISASEEATVQGEWDQRISDEVTPWVTTSYVLWGYAGVTAIASAILLYPDLTADSPKAASAWVSPMYVPDGAGVCGGVSF